MKRGAVLCVGVLLAAATGGAVAYAGDMPEAGTRGTRRTTPGATCAIATRARSGGPASNDSAEYA